MLMTSDDQTGDFCKTVTDQVVVLFLHVCIMTGYLCYSGHIRFYTVSDQVAENQVDNGGFILILNPIEFQVDPAIQIRPDLRNQIGLAHHQRPLISVGRVGPNLVGQVGLRLSIQVGLRFEMGQTI